MHHPEQGEVIDLMRDVLPGRAGHRRLELAGQIREVGVADEAPHDGLNHRRAVDDLVGGNPRQRRTEHDPRRITAGLRGAQTHRFQPPPDLRHVPHIDPVQLDVLPVGEVGQPPTELSRNSSDDPQLRGGQRAAVGTYPQHEELVVQFGRRQRRGLATGNAGLALGVEAPPPESPAQIVLRDGCEAVASVDPLDPLAHGQPALGRLEHFVLVQRRGGAQCPLTLVAGRARSPWARPAGRVVG